VEWDAVTGSSTGNSAITAYSLYWNNGVGTSADIYLAEGLFTTYTIAGLVANRDYYFKVRAKNIYGYGPFSTIEVIRTSDRPHTMDPIDTVRVGTDMVLSWVAPQTGGETIDAYEIKIYIPSSDTYISDPTCDATVDPAFSAL